MNDTATPLDPRPVLEQIDRCYPYGAVVPSEYGVAAINTGSGPAAWYRPLLAPDIATARPPAPWPTQRAIPAQKSAARNHDIAARLATERDRPAPPTPEEIARLAACRRARAAARFKDIGEEA